MVCLTFCPQSASLHAPLKEVDTTRTITRQATGPCEKFVYPFRDLPCSQSRSRNTVRQSVDPYADQAARDTGYPVLLIR